VSSPSSAATTPAEPLVPGPDPDAPPEATWQGVDWGYIAKLTVAWILWIAALLGAWMLAIKVWDLPESSLPTPRASAQAVLDYRDLLWDASRVTLVETLIGFVVAVVVGVALSVVIVSSRWASRLLMPTLVAFNTIPKVALAPLLVIWFGLGANSKVAMAVFLAVFPIVINMVSGLRRVDPVVLEYFALQRASGLKTMVKARIPNSLPWLLDGMKIALPLAIIGAIVGEFIVSTEGIGFLIITAYGRFNTPLAFAAVFVLAVASLVLYGLLSLAARLLLRNRPTDLQ
jgi:NitT/TauT family transport system permease protein